MRTEEKRNCMIVVNHCFRKQNYRVVSESTADKCTLEILVNVCQ